MNVSRTHKGFTLLELMIAIAIFGVISTAAYKLFATVTQAQEVTQSVLDILDKQQRAEVIVENDLLQVAPRPIRDEQGVQQPALIAPGKQSLIEFTRSGWGQPFATHPQQLTASGLQHRRRHLDSLLLAHTGSTTGCHGDSPNGIKGHQACQTALSQKQTLGEPMASRYSEPRSSAMVQQPTKRH